MKKIQKLFTLLLASVFIISCSSDDNSLESQDIETKIIGNWGLVSYEEKGEFTELDKCQLENTKLIIFADKTAKEQFGNSYQGSCDIEYWDHKYKIIDRELFLEEEDNIELRYNILHLDSSSMVLQLTYIKEQGHPAIEYEDKQGGIWTFKK